MLLLTKIHAHHTIYDLMYYVFVYITMLLLTKNTCTPHHIWPDVLCLCIHYYAIIDNKYLHTTPCMTWDSMTLYTSLLLLTMNICTSHHVQCNCLFGVILLYPNNISQTMMIIFFWHIYASVNLASLVQVMACHLVGTKPLSEPILEYCELDT